MQKKVYVWELPVRATHWINALCIVALAFTGFYIGRPFIHAVSTNQYIMGWIRLIHFIAAYLLVVSCLVRVYWAFAGNRYAGWEVFNPFDMKKLKDLVELSKFYLLLRKEPPSHVTGHSACATYVYLSLFVLYIIEAATGFALYSQSHLPGFLWTLMGGWLLLFVDAQSIRLYHHFFMWLFITFAIVHVYLSLFMESKEDNGILMSIFSGNKTVDEKYE
jgi:Ni/Fe-hydrogenase 1 B-type cytochrome subunit